MSPTNTETPSLSSIAAAFTQWHTQRKKRSPVPPALCQQAISLIGAHSKIQIIQALNITYAMLNRWIKDFALQASSRFCLFTPG